MRIIERIILIYNKIKNSKLILLVTFIFIYLVISWVRNINFFESDFNMMATILLIPYMCFSIAALSCDNDDRLVKIAMNTIVIMSFIIVGCVLLFGDGELSDRLSNNGYKLSVVSFICIVITCCIISWYTLNINNNKPNPLSRFGSISFIFGSFVFCMYFYSVCFMTFDYYSISAFNSNAIVYSSLPVSIDEQYSKIDSLFFVFRRGSERVEYNEDPVKGDHSDTSVVTTMLKDIRNDSDRLGSVAGHINTLTLMKIKNFVNANRGREFTIYTFGYASSERNDIIQNSNLAEMRQRNIVGALMNALSIRPGFNTEYEAKFNFDHIAWEINPENKSEFNTYVSDLTFGNITNDNIDGTYLGNNYSAKIMIIAGKEYVGFAMEKGLAYLDYLYFSIYTMTTSAYGDIKPVHPYVKFLVSMANLTQVFFLMVVVNMAFYTSKTGGGGLEAS